MSRIAFDRSLYTPEAVEAAAAAYAEYAKIGLERAADATVAVIGDVTGGDRHTIENSFCNLALQETIVRMHHTASREEE
jgi:hypothetical protein